MRKVLYLLLFLSIVECKAVFKKQTPEPQMPEYRTAKGYECGVRARNAHSDCVKGCSSFNKNGQSAHLARVGWLEIHNCVNRCNKTLEEHYELCFEEDKKQ